MFEHELADYTSYIRNISELKPDGFIVADPGAVYALNRIRTGIPLHLSTQANTLNSNSVKFWKENKIKRINLGRELSVKDISEIKKNCHGVELEIFIHGAICISFSGKCFMSDFLTANSANKGKCKHPCRWKYKIIEEKRNKDVFILEEGEQFTSFFSPYDLMSLEYLEALMKINLDSFKIEGRMKGPFYTGMVVHAYRKNIERIIKGGDIDRNDITRLLYTTNRGYGYGFFNRGSQDDFSHKEYEHLSGSGHCFIGIVNEVRDIRNERFIGMKLKNNISLDAEVEFITPDSEHKMTVHDILDDSFNSISEAKPNSKVYIKIDNLPVSNNDILYRTK